MDEAVQRYIDAIPTEQRSLFDRLQSLILELYPEAELVISYREVVNRAMRSPARSSSSR